MRTEKQFATVILALAGVTLFTASLEARTCSGDGLVVGTYAFTASRSGFFLLDATAAPTGSPSGSGPLIPVSITPPGSTTTTTTTSGTTAAPTTYTGSSTSIGSLVAGLNNPSVFSGVGQVSADGNGNLYASPGVGLPANVPAGTYNVNLDCSITLSLYDPFTPGTGTAATGMTIPTTTTTSTGAVTITQTIIGASMSGLKGGQVNLQGELLNDGGEIDAAIAGVNGAGATLKLTKSSQFNACSNASLAGNYAITGNGFALPSAGTGQVTNTGTTATIGTMTGTTTGTTTSALPAPATTCTTLASGTITTSTTINGTTTTGTATNCIVPETGAFLSGATGSFGTPFNLLGRFVADGNGNFVNDTAGVQSPLTASLSGTYTVNSDCTGTGKLIDQSNISRDINFVLSNNSAQCSTATSAQSSCVQQLQFVFSDPGVFGSGTATQQ